VLDLLGEREDATAIAKELLKSPRKEISVKAWGSDSIGVCDEVRQLVVLYRSW